MLYTFNEGGASALLLADYVEATSITNIAVGVWAWLPLLLMWMIEAPIIFIYGDEALPSADNADYVQDANHLWHTFLSWDTAITLPFDLTVVTPDPYAEDYQARLPERIQRLEGFNQAVMTNWIGRTGSMIFEHSLTWITTSFVYLLIDLVIVLCFVPFILLATG